MADGLGVATGIQELIRQQQLGSAGGTDIDTARSLVEQQPTRVPTPDEDLLEPGGITGQGERRAGAISMFKDNPLGAIGLLLSNFSAGFHGRELPSTKLLEQQRQDELLKLRRMESRIVLLTNFQKITKGMSAEKTKQLAEQMEATIPGFGELFETIGSLSDPQGALDFAGEHSKLIQDICGEDRDCIIDKATDPKFVAEANRRIDELNVPQINSKMALITEGLKGLSPEDNINIPRDGQGNLMLNQSNLDTLNDQIQGDMKLTPSELRTIERNPDMLLPFGIKTTGIAKIEAEARAKEAAKAGKVKAINLKPAEIKQLGLPEGSVVQEREDGSLNIVFKPAAPDQRDKKIKNLMEQGLEKEDATNITDGIVDLEIVPATGRARLINKLNNEVKEISIGDEVARDLETGKQLAPAKTLFELADLATGAISGTLELASDTLGQLPGVPVAVNTIDARQTLLTATTELVRSLSINPRFPVGEIERIEREIKLKPSFFKSPDALKIRMKSIDRSLRTRSEQAQRDADNPNLPEKTRSAQATNANSIRNFLTILGAPQQPEELTDEEQRRLEELRGN